MLSLSGAFNHKEDNEASRYEGHSNDDEDGNQYIGGLTVTAKIKSREMWRHLSYFAEAKTNNTKVQQSSTTKL